MSKKPQRKIHSAPIEKIARKRSARPVPRTNGASKLDRIVSALRAHKGATIADLMEITSWQAHSVRGALSGALKKDRGLSITSSKTGAERIYRIESGK